MKIKDLSHLNLLRNIAQHVKNGCATEVQHMYLGDIAAILHDAGIEPLPYDAISASGETGVAGNWEVMVEFLSPVEKYIMKRYFSAYPEGLTWDELIEHWLRADPPPSVMRMNELGDMYFNSLGTDQDVVNELNNELQQLNELMKATK